MAETQPPTTLQEAQAQLAALGTEKWRAIVLRHGGPADAYGVNLGDVRKLAKAIKSNHALGLDLWASGQYESMLLATLIMKPKLFTADELDSMAASVDSTQVASYLMTHIVNLHPEHEALRRRWMAAAEPMRARGGWSLTRDRVAKKPEGLDVPGLLDRIDAEMGTAAPEAQWTMNYCLAQIGISFAEHRDRAIAIGERLGVYRDYPVAKGCVSPFAPAWIRHVVGRQQ